MARTFEKIVLGIIFIVLVGLNSLFIFGQQNSFEVQRNAGKSAKLAISTQPKEIDFEQAKAIALGVTNGIITEVEEKIIDGVAFYEVEIENDDLETEIKIDKKSGNILQLTWEEKEIEEEVSSEELQTITGILTQEQAKSIASKLIGGNVIGFGAEKEDGILIYEVKVSAQGDVAEVEIDAATGKVLEIEWGEDD